MKLLNFDLEKALKNPERIVFIDGSKVADFKYFPTASTPFNLFVQNKHGHLFNYTKNGETSGNSFLSLKLLPLTKTYYYCLFEDENNKLYTSHYFLLKKSCTNK